MKHKKTGYLAYLLLAVIFAGLAVPGCLPESGKVENATEPAREEPARSAEESRPGETAAPVVPETPREETR
ncbi:MAG: hypothetical protein K2H64_11655, partial [Desulfovibrio sp.]|nr:hypothetical protein [Desulfovibrio sp.]